MPTQLHEVAVAVSVVAAADGLTGSGLATGVAVVTVQA